MFAFSLRRRSVVTLAVALWGLLMPLIARPVAAQETSTTTTTSVAPTTTSSSTTSPASTSTSSSSTSTSTTTTPVPGSSTTIPSTTSTPPADGDDPNATTTTTAFDPDRDLEPDEDIAAEDDAAPPEEVPVVEDTVPPDPDETVDGEAAQRLIQRELRVAQADAVRSAELVAEAATLVDQLSDRLALLQRALAKLDVAQALAVRRLAAAQERFEERIANAVVRGNAAQLDTLFTSADANQAQTRKTYLESVSQADIEAVIEYRAAKDLLDSAVLDALDSVARTRRELRDARTSLQEAIRENTAKKFELAVFAAGSKIVIYGFVFPVAEPYQFIDSWGFPRMVGTEYEHGHQGTDIFAPFGTPLLACERGIVTRIGTDVLGGTKLWVKGQSGTYYYYAHLSAYADGVVEGQLVEAGDVIGFVGDTGNARGGTPHLHFQVHPGGGEPVNPYGLLRVIADLSRRE